MEPRFFSYTPLRPSEDIRLVVLEPGEFGSSLRCRLITANFSSNPVYEALSYVWGPQEDPCLAMLNGEVKLITANLWSALTHLREFDQQHQGKGQDVAPRCLWIDALCINQEDVSERNHQVQQMSRIYSQAATVLIWLGPSGNQSDVAMKALKCRTALKSQTGWYGPLIKLLDREYWKRMWIVQEVGLGQRLKIHCGFQRVDWRGLNYVHHHLDSFAEWGLTFGQSLLLMRTLALRIDRHRMDRESTGTKLQQLLETCQDCRCSDPRDKVYALLGFADDCNADNLVVDYSKSVFDVFEDVVAFLSTRLTPKVQRLDPGDAIRFIQTLVRLFGAREEMDRRVEEAKKEVQAFPPSWINAAGVCDEVIYKSSPLFDRPNVSAAFQAAGIMSDLDQIAAGASSRTAITQSFAINGYEAYKKPDSAYDGHEAFIGDNAHKFHFSAQLAFFTTKRLKSPGRNSKGELHWADFCLA